MVRAHSDSIHHMATVSQAVLGVNGKLAQIRVTFRQQALVDLLEPLLSSGRLGLRQFSQGRQLAVRHANFRISAGRSLRSTRSRPRVLHTQDWRGSARRSRHSRRLCAPSVPGRTAGMENRNGSRPNFLHDADSVAENRDYEHDLKQCIGETQSGVIPQRNVHAPDTARHLLD